MLWAAGVCGCLFILTALSNNILHYSVINLYFFHRICIFVVRCVL